jgi:hypothetical protein
MKVTKTQLQQLIQEETQAILNEEEFSYDDPRYEGTGARLMRTPELALQRQKEFEHQLPSNWRQAAAYNPDAYERFYEKSPAAVDLPYMRAHYFGDPATWEIMQDEPPWEQPIVSRARPDTAAEWAKYQHMPRAWGGLEFPRERGIGMPETAWPHLQGIIQEELETLLKEHESTMTHTHPKIDPVKHLATAPQEDFGRHEMDKFQSLANMAAAGSEAALYDLEIAATRYPDAKALLDAIAIEARGPAEDISLRNPPEVVGTGGWGTGGFTPEELEYMTSDDPEMYPRG